MKEHCPRDGNFAGSDLGAMAPGPDGKGHISARATEVVRAGLASDTAYGAVMPPLYLSSNFRFAGLEDPPPYDYTRSANPTREHLTDALAQLEGGAGAVATSSGMSAVGVVLNLVHADDLVLAPHD